VALQIQPRQVCRRVRRPAGFCPQALALFSMSGYEFSSKFQVFSLVCLSTYIIIKSNPKTSPIFHKIILLKLYLFIFWLKFTGVVPNLRDRSASLKLPFLPANAAEVSPTSRSQLSEKQHFSLHFPDNPASVCHATPRHQCRQTNRFQSFRLLPHPLPPPALYVKNTAPPFKLKQDFCTNLLAIALFWLFFPGLFGFGVRYLNNPSVMQFCRHGNRAVPQP